MNPIDKINAQKQIMSLLAGGLDHAPKAEGKSSPDFKEVLLQAIRDVNNAQNTAQAKVQQFSTGESNLSIEEVMTSLQKANLSFQTMVAVRNKLVEAYKEVTNMQI